MVWNTGDAACCCRWMNAVRATEENVTLHCIAVLVLRYRRSVGLVGCAKDRGRGEPRRNSFAWTTVYALCKSERQQSIVLQSKCYREEVYK